MPTPKPASWKKAIGPNGEKRSIPAEVARRVWIAAGGRCTFCNKNLLFDELTGQDIFIGQLAHIVGWKKAGGSPRSGHPDAPRDRNAAENLMLICYDQHHVIDDRSMWDIYSVEKLRELKRGHESAMRRLTSLRDSRSTVLRVIGSIGSVAVEASRRAVAEALLERGLFPDYALLGYDAEYEVDLRHVPGEVEGASEYWAHAETAIGAACDRIRLQVASGDISRLSVIAIARIPILVALGNAIGDGIPVELYPTRGPGGGFGWTPGLPATEFAVTERQPGTDPMKIAVLFSLSGVVDVARLPSGVVGTCTIYEVRPTNVAPGVNVVASAESSENFTRCWRELLSHLEAEHPGGSTVSVFPAVGVVPAIIIGRSLHRAAHPPLLVFDLNSQSNEYEFALAVER